MKGTSARWIARGFAAALALSHAGCSSSGSGSPADETPATGVFGVVTAVGGAPIAGVTVRAGASSGTTDAAGRYAIRTSAGPVVLRFESPAHVDGFQRATVLEDEASAVNATLFPLPPAVDVDAEAGADVSGERGALISVPAGALVTRDGTPVEGTVQVYLRPLDPSVANEFAAAPADLRAAPASGTTQLESWGMLDITIRQNGERLDFAEGTRALIHIPAPASPNGEPPATMPLWSFDETNAVWREEGTLTWNDDLGVFEGEIEHLSWWNADLVLETGCVCGEVVDDADVPLAGARVLAQGVDYFGFASATSGADGRFCVEGRIDSAVSLLVYHDASGGTTVPARTGTATSTVPPTNPAVCTDAGRIRVRRGAPDFPARGGASCGDVLRTFEGCVPAYADLGRCYDPAGACTSTTSGLFDTTLTYANGARTVSTISLNAQPGAPSIFVIEFIGSSGRTCGTQTSTVVDGASTTTFETSTGASQQFSTQPTGNGGARITCVDGSVRNLTEAQMNELRFCTGGDDDTCVDDGSGGGSGTECSTTGDCPGSLICCALTDLCLPASLCVTGEACAVDNDCSGDRICCQSLGTLSTCTAADECFENRSCTTTADCREGSECCNGTCDVRGFCGACRNDADCTGTDEVCCDNSESGREPSCEAREFCYFTGRTCATNDDCGPADDRGNFCCDQGDRANTCVTSSLCYEDNPCGSNADCGGAGSDYICCESFLAQASVCQVEEACDLFKPCTDDSECLGAAVCCGDTGNDFANRCAREASGCFVTAPCETNADCGTGTGLTCCAAFGNRCFDAEVCPG